MRYGAVPQHSDCTRDAGSPANGNTGAVDGSAPQPGIRGPLAVCDAGGPWDCC